MMKMRLKMQKVVVVVAAVAVDSTDSSNDSDDSGGGVSCFCKQSPTPTRPSQLRQFSSCHPHINSKFRLCRSRHF